MTTPQPANAPAGVNPATPALFAIVGGALGVIGFFLPLVATSTGGAQGGTPHTVTYSFWELTNHYLTGANLSGVTATGQPTSTAPYVAALLALPAVLALVALVAGGVGVLRGLGPVQASVIGAAGLMGVFNGGSSLIPTSLLLSALGGGTGDTSATGLGLIVMQVGFFVLLVGGIMAVAQARRAAA